MSSNNLRLNIENDIAWVTIDIADNEMNALNMQLVDEFGDLCNELERQRNLAGVILISGKPNVFVAGADINTIHAARKAEEGEALTGAAQTVFNRLEQLSMPVVAAVNGPALGGGYELVLACSAIVATDDPATNFGLPEVMLGVLPGGGGCQRLPRRIGLVKSLDILLTGRQVPAKKALSLGMVDTVVPFPVLKEAAVKWVKKLADGKRPTRAKRGLQHYFLEANWIGRSIVFKKARAKVERQTRGNYPAPGFILDCVETGLNKGIEAGYAAERKLFGKLAISPESKALVGLFFAGNALKKEKVAVDGPVQVISQLGIVGGGLMGGGIADVSINQAGSNVRIKDISDDGLRNALKHLYQGWQRKVKRKSLTTAEKRALANKVTTTLDYSGFEKTELVIEAIFEKLEVKQKLLSELEQLPGAERRIFASNTSSLRIRDIAAHAKYPENVIGMHYFSPVEKMPLLEVIRHQGTSDAVAASCVDYGRKQGKTVIVVKDGAGFYINRVLGPYINEAAHLLSEGVPIDAVDNALVNWGLPVGPFKLLDEVGIDVVSKVRPNLESEFGERMASTGILEQLIADDRLGKKNERGFYLYGGKHSGPDPAIYSSLNISPNGQVDDATIVARCTFIMLNEAVLCLQDGTIRCARDGDIGAVHGFGYPPFLGGPFRTIENMGIATVVERLWQYADKYGARFTPAKMLEQLADSGASFYSSDMI